MKKKVLAIISIAAMLVAMVPSMVFATVDDSHVAKIDENGYTTLQEAINKGGEITLLKDVKENITVPAGKTVTLNLNGKNIIPDSGSAILNKGSLTIKGEGTVKSKNNCAMFVGTDSITVIEGGNFVAQEAAVTGSSTTVGATVTIKDGIFTAKDNYVIGDNGRDRTGKENTFNIEGGTFNGKIQTSGYVACGVYAPWNDIINISGGTFNIENGAGIVARSGKVTISDNAKFKCTGKVKGKVGDSSVVVPCAPIVFDSEAKYPAITENSGIEVKGGTFTAEVENVDVIAPAHDTNSRVGISGGSFDKDVSEYLAEGYVHMIYNVGIFEVLEESVAEMEAVCEYQYEKDNKTYKIYAKDKDMIKGSLELNDEAAGKIETTGYYVTFFNMTPQGEIDEENPYQVIVHEEGTIQDALDQRTEMYDDTLQAKEYEGYKFVGWYELDDNKNFTNKVNFGETVSQNIDYYSRYEKVTAAKADAPKTGDESNMMLPIAIALIALAGIATVVATRRKHN